MVPHQQWLRLREPAQHYANGLSSFQGHKAFIEEAVRLADDAVDFSNTDVVVVLAAPSATPVGYGPTWTGPLAPPLWRMGVGLRMRLLQVRISCSGVALG